eukprot:scaffold115618_cov37-Tisochrysis_lutea.AAC.1
MAESLAMQRLHELAEEHGVRDTLVALEAELDSREEALSAARVSLARSQLERDQALADLERERGEREREREEERERERGREQEREEAAEAHEDALSEMRVMLLESEIREKEALKAMKLALSRAEALAAEIPQLSARILGCFVEESERSEEPTPCDRTGEGALVASRRLSLEEGLMARSPE